MEWIQNPNQYKSVEEAILGMSGQTELELLSPDTVPPDCVDGIPEAARAIQLAIENKIPVKIVGDYDVDGITSTAILTKLLNYYGVEPSTYIPKRFTDGYGVSEKILAGVKNTLIITVDNGIAAGDVLDKAVEEGRNGVVVLDHHLPDGREPKNAIAVVDPYLHPDMNEFTEYCGAGLAFKLAEYMLLDEPLATAEKLLNDIQVLACFGTIADSMPLIGDNRRIVMDGIALVNSGRAMLSQGISQLLTIGCNGSEFSVETVSYNIAPLINAPGRLYNAGGTSSLKMLMCDDPIEAQTYGAKMVQINKQRQTQVSTWMKKIQEALSKSTEEIAPVVVFEPEMPEGLIGLVAGKLASTYHCPAIVMVRGENGIVKGSARTYGEFHIKDMLDTMSSLFTTYGGHAGAAGISLMQSDIEEFRQKVRAYFKDYQTSGGGEYVLYDVVLAPEDVPAALEVIKKYQPLGQGVPNPVCRINQFAVDAPFYMGADKSHIKFPGQNFAAVAFGMAGQYVQQGEPKSIDMVGTIGENTFQGRTTTQLMLQDFKPHYRAISIERRGGPP